MTLLVCPALLGDDVKAFVITRSSLNGSYASSTTRPEDRICLIMDVSFPLAVKLKAKSDSTTFLDIFTPLNIRV